MGKRDGLGASTGVNREQDRRRAVGVFRKEGRRDKFLRATGDYAKNAEYLIKAVEASETSCVISKLPHEQKKVLVDLLHIMELSLLDIEQLAHMYQTLLLND